MMKTIFRVAVLCGLCAVSTALAAPGWVTDQFEITLRSGPSTSNAIQLMVDSGTRLEVLERDAETGYSRVRTAGGTEGWVVSRYLMNEPSAREQLENLTKRLTDASTEGASLNSQLIAIQNEYQAANQRIAELEDENGALQQELDEIKRTAANVLAIDDQNRSLMDQLATTQIRVDTLEQENRQLGSQTTRYWFMTGALVLLGGIILGIWLPRIRWQRRSRYDRF
jgi:SH3 domain protein